MTCFYATSLENFVHAENVPRKTLIQMSTLVALLRSIASGKETLKRKKNNEPINLLQQNTNPTTSDRLSACRTLHVDTRAGPRNAQLQSRNRQPFIPWTTGRHCPRRSLPVWLAQLDV